MNPVRLRSSSSDSVLRKKHRVINFQCNGSRLSRFCWMQRKGLKKLDCLLFSPIVRKDDPIHAGYQSMEAFRGESDDEGADLLAPVI